MSRSTDTSLSASEAAERLGVKLDTVYAYVSRGLLTRLPGVDKESRFAAAEVAQLAARGRRSAVPKAEPLLVTTVLTEVSSQGVFYRGKNASALAERGPFERVAEWLWAVEDPGAQPFTAPKAAVTLARALQAGLPEDTLPLDRLRVIATVLGSTDPLRYDTSPAAVVQCARGLIAGLIEGLPRAGHRPEGPAPLALRLWSQLTAARPIQARVQVLDLALGLCADHALSPSTLAVRVAASQRADPYALVQTGLGALSGALHGAASLSAEELLAEVEAGADAKQVIGARLRRAERIPGFGHTLHAAGDPREQALGAALRQHYARSRAVSAADAVEHVMRERGLPLPNVDWGLAFLVRASGMQRGASEAIMAVARVAGWIAHALEEYRAPTKFPWRALYVGPKAEAV